MRVLVGGVVLLLLGMADLVVTWLRYAPAIRDLQDSPPGLTNQMRRAGVSAPPEWIPLAQVPGVLACAVQVAEDPRFLEYSGVDWSRQIQILRRTIRGDQRFGGSGIAQQLARNLYLTPDFSPRRKVREWLLAINIGRTLSHHRQLELYLNVAQWGPEAWGIAQGAQAVLSKPLDALSASDAVLLALTLPAPSRGFGYSLHAARRARMDRLPQQLWERGVLNEVEAAAATARLHQWISATASTGSPGPGRQQVHAVMGEDQPWRGSAVPTLECRDGARWVP